MICMLLGLLLLLAPHQTTSHHTALNHTTPQNTHMHSHTTQKRREGYGTQQLM